MTKLGERLLRWMGGQAGKPSGLPGRVMGYGMAWGHGAHRTWALSHLDVRPADRVLDVGCGAGVAVQRIAAVAVEGYVCGIDHSPEMVAQARRRNAAAIRAGRVGIVHGSVAALPYADASFDAVIGVETFYFWPGPLHSLREVHRVLRGPGGGAGAGGVLALAMEASKESPRWPRLAARTDRMGFPLYSGPEMVDLLTAAGFSQAWFASAPDRGIGWLCALARK